MGMQIMYLILSIFLLYTWVYTIQWVLGLFIALYELSFAYKRKLIVKWIVTEEQAVANKVSVIIAAYNEENCVIDTIQSLMEENYPNLEIILVDDGSKDNMAEKVKNTFHLKAMDEKRKNQNHTYFENQIDDRTLMMISKPNGGKSRALNVGISYCSGKYCLVVDADTRVERGSIKSMVSRFIEDDRTIVCAGAVANEDGIYSQLGFKEKCLLIYQTLEYYRTFYMQRILLDMINANFVVSGAFAMFDVSILRMVGGYNEDTIGEDMELTLRLHAFCKSQQRKYKIRYTPDAKCTTQFPFTYQDFFRQRRRWQIGMLQSLKNHRYMLMNRYYGWVGTLSSAFFILYELAAPFIEVLGFFTLIIIISMELAPISFVVLVMFIYYNLMILMQMALVLAVNIYEIERIPTKKKIDLLLISCVEAFTFHILNTAIKIIAVISRKKHKKTWQHISRA